MSRDAPNASKIDAISSKTSISASTLSLPNTSTFSCQCSRVRPRSTAGRTTEFNVRKAVRVSAC